MACDVCCMSASVDWLTVHEGHRHSAILQYLPRCGDEQTPVLLLATALLNIVCAPCSAVPAVEDASEWMLHLILLLDVNYPPCVVTLRVPPSTCAHVVYLPLNMKPTYSIYE